MTWNRDDVELERGDYDGEYERGDWDGEYDRGDYDGERRPLQGRQQANREDSRQADVEAAGEV